MVRGIRLVDLMYSAVGMDESSSPSKPEGTPRTAGLPRGLIRDPDSLRYTGHAAEYMFKRSEHSTREARKRHDLDVLDEFGVQMARISISSDDPDRSLRLLERHPDRFFGALSIDPHEGMSGVRRLEAMVRKNPGIKAATFFSGYSYPQVAVNDKVIFPYYAKCIELDIPIFLNVGVPGPRVPMAGQMPHLLDEVCYLLPELKIIMAHGGEPWGDLCWKLMLKWPNLYYCTSGFAPKHYLPEIINFANTRGAEKVMYAGYYPNIPYDRLVRELDQLPLREHVWPLFLRENANQLLKLGLE